MSDVIYRCSGLHGLMAELEGCRAEQRFTDLTSLYGIAIGAAGIAVGCAMDYFGGPEYHAFAKNLAVLGLAIAGGSVCLGRIHY